jgi:very-short-patch-repair endonuclease
MGNPMLGYWYKLYKDQTKQEQAVEKEVCKLGIRYRTQHPFLSQRAFADFYFPDYNLIVEIDDPSHEEPEKIKKDLERTKRLQALNLTILRFTNRQVDKELPSVMEVIVSATTGFSREKTASSSDDQDPSSQVPALQQSHPKEDHGQPTHVKRAKYKRSRSKRS